MEWMAFIDQPSRRVIYILYSDYIAIESRNPIWMRIRRLDFFMINKIMETFYLSMDSINKCNNWIDENEIIIIL